MHYILSIIRISLIVFLLTNKTIRGNINEIFNQFLEYLNDAFKRQVGIIYFNDNDDDYDDDTIIEEDINVLKEIKEEVIIEEEIKVEEEEVKENEIKVEEEVKVKENEIKVEEEVKVIKFEDKYLEKYKAFKNEYYFTEEEILLEKQNYDEAYNSFFKTKIASIKETSEKLNVINSIFDKGGIGKNDGIEELVKYYNIETEYDDDPDDFDLQELLDELTDVKKELDLKLVTLTNTSFSEEENLDAAKKFVLDKKLDGFINNYVIEMTPLGNVYMRFNNSKKSFEYFSNNTIPYRYLEPVGRKYVTTYFCKPLFIDIEEELKRAQTKKDAKDELAKEEKNIIKKEGVKEGKDIFTRLKSYNNDSSSHMKNKNRNQPSAPLPPQIKANLPNVNGSEKMLLKENANRYTWEGRMANVSFLKKVDKKMVDKNYEMSFADFKKMQTKK